MQGTDNSRRGGGQGDLEIIEERTMLAIPRGSDELRFRFVRARKPNGGETAWHDLRLWWRGDDGQWRPGQKGISVRTSELRPLLEALTKATQGQQPQRPAGARTPQHRESHARQPSLPASPTRDGVNDDEVF